MKNIKLKNKQFFWIIVVIIISFFSFNSLLRQGYIPMHDDMQPIRLQQLDKCIKDGQIPCRWTADLGYGYGYPMFIFYSPLVYYFMEIFHLVGFSLLTSIKIGFIFSFIFSAITMFIFVKSIWGNLAGLVSSAFYVYAPFRASDVYSRGAVGEFWALGFFPLILWAILNLIKKPDHKRNSLYLSISVAGLLITHNLSSVAFFPIALIWTFILLFHYKKWKIFHKLLFSIVIAGFLSSFYTIPLVFEKSFVHLDSMISGYFNYLAHFTSIGQLFFRGHWGFGSSELGPNDDLSFSIGVLHYLSLLSTLILSIKYRIFKKNNLTKLIIIFFSFVFVFSSFLTHSRSAFIWKIFSFLKYFQFPWRFLTITMLSTSVLAAFPIFLLKHQKKHAFIYTSILIFLVIYFNSRLFRPSSYIQINDQQKLSGENLEYQITASIYDYLPIFANQPPSAKAPETPQLIKGSAQIINFQKGSNWQKGSLVADQDSTIQLPSFYYPGFKLWINDQISDLTYDNNLGIITFQIPKGNHHFYLKLTNTPDRIVGDILTIIGILMLALYV